MKWEGGFVSCLGRERVGSKTKKTQDGLGSDELQLVMARGRKVSLTR